MSPLLVINEKDILVLKQISFNEVAVLYMRDLTTKTVLLHVNRLSTIYDNYQCKQQVKCGKCRNVMTSRGKKAKHLKNRKQRKSHFCSKACTFLAPKVNIFGSRRDVNWHYHKFVGYTTRLGWPFTRLNCIDFRSEISWDLVLCRSIIYEWKIN
jgi:hypothetical protein